VTVGGVVLTATGSTGGEYVFPQQRLDPGQVLTVTEAQLGFRPANDEKLFLYRPNKTALLDAHTVTNRLRGRSEEYGDRWLYPSEATPGQPNAFDFEDEVVINEIMYHAFPDLATPATPPTYDTTLLLGIDANTRWRYNQSGAALAGTWAQKIHPVDNVTWFQGAALLAYETTPAVLPEPIRTTLKDPRTNSPYVITYYFETEFEFDGDPEAVELSLRHVIDDGAVFYLNGTEVYRFGFDEGEVVTAGSYADLVGNAAYNGPVLIPADRLRVGTNTFSVEVHQTNSSSSDIVFGMELSALGEVIPGTPGTPFEESGEEWIELFNRGSQPVALDGWKLAGGIDFEFADGTTIGPGEYLVVAANAAALAAKYPSIHIAGSFAGQLNNDEDRILLVDANKNPADEVHYYEAGRWPVYADGGGSSLELRNPFADNSKAEAWAASDETSKSSWQTYTVTGTATEPLEVSTVFNEFIFGLLDSGELLIDDISVVLDPGSSATEMIQNGGFWDDPVGAAPATWRLIGTHSGQVEADPEDPGDMVLHVTADGPQQFVHDHVETTFLGNTAIQSGHEYQISFRAKWLAGNSQLYNRLYFTRMGNVVQLDVPRNNGTPGAVNSRYQANVGPTYSDFKHTPVLPQAYQSVTVSVRADDPDVVSLVRLYWKTDGGGLNGSTMAKGADGVYRATIPGYAGGTVVQFWVEGRDALGFTSTFPAGGAASRALYEVNDGQAPSTPVDTFRIVMLQADVNNMFSDVNVMSNQYVGGTLLYNNQEAYYDVGVRIVGSRFVRPDSGYKVDLGPDQKFLGVHSSLRFDFSGGGAKEIFIKQMVNRAGGSSVSLYDDIAYMITPRHSGRIVLLQLARYEDVFLDEQFQNGGDGTLFELDDITYPTNPDPYPEGLKTGTGVSSPDLNDRGSDPEAYRGQVLIKNNRAADDYSGIVAMAGAIHKSGQELYDATNAVMDVDLWMRHYATQAFLGNWDTYGFRRPKNLRIYQRPEDGKMIPLYWDADLANFTEPLIYNGGASRLDDIRNLPQNLRLFYGHLLDLVNRSFNDEYISSWIAHYTTLAGSIFGNAVSLVASREAEVRSFIAANAPFVPFDITTNGGAPITVHDTGATLDGRGWIDVREIHLSGSTQPLSVTWTGFDTWRVSVPVAPGTHTIRLEAYGFRGELVGSDEITVTSTVTERPLADFLRVTEIMYNPPVPTPEEAVAGYDANGLFEFIELVNTSTAATLDLGGVTLSEAVDFTFGQVELAPGGRIVVVRDEAAFRRRYGPDATVAGTFDGKLGGDDHIRLADPFGQAILDFSYGSSGAWPGRADGKGAALELIDPAGTDPADLGLAHVWQSSVAYGGTPGEAPLEASGVVISEVLTHTDPPLRDAIELYNTTDQAIPIGGWYLSDSWGWDYSFEDGDYRKFCVPANTWIQPHEYIVFYEGHYEGDLLVSDPLVEFGGSGPKDFALSSAGDEIWLMETDADGRLRRFADHVTFGGALNGVSFGLWPDAAGVLVPLKDRTLGEANDSPGNGPRFGPLVIGEVMYRPAAPTSADLAICPALVADDLQYVEIVNPTDAAVDLSVSWGAAAYPWKLEGFEFPAGTTIGPSEALVVLSFDPGDPGNAARTAAFRNHYGLATSAVLLGGFGGVLSDYSETITLSYPDEPFFNPGGQLEVPYVLIDQVTYVNASPWPVIEPPGSELSLHRTSAVVWGHDAGNWTAGPPTPLEMTEPLVSRLVAAHVFYNNSAFDGYDAGADARDDDALDPGKVALRPGEGAHSEHYTSYTRGLNGVMIDIEGPVAASLVASADPYSSDFEFRVGRGGDPLLWRSSFDGLDPVPLPTVITVRADEGDDASNRVTLIWPDGAIRNQWLEVRLVANGHTGLLDDEVFCFGNLPGETGSDPSQARVDTRDVMETRLAAVASQPALPGDPHDFNRDGAVSYVDVVLCRLAARRGDRLTLLEAPISAATQGLWPEPVLASAAGDLAPSITGAPAAVVSASASLGSADHSALSQAAGDADAESLLTAEAWWWLLELDQADRPTSTTKTTSAEVQAVDLALIDWPGA
jgi:hypothetical protein